MRRVGALSVEFASNMRLMSFYIVRRLLEWWDIQWVIPRTVKQLFEWWFSWKFSKLRKLLWDCIPVVVIWSIWIVRNEVRFKRLSVDWDRVLELIKWRIGTWVKAKYGCGILVQGKPVVVKLLQDVWRCFVFELRSLGWSFLARGVSKFLGYPTFLPQKLVFEVEDILLLLLLASVALQAGGVVGVAQLFCGNLHGR
ncbi:hypothetical protein Dimus_027551 [Dionaea muscipula]